MFYHEGPQVILQGRISRTEIQQVFDNGEVIINEWKNGQNHRKRGKTLTKKELEELIHEYDTIINATHNTSQIIEDIAY